MHPAHLSNRVCTSKPTSELPVVNEHLQWKFNKEAYPSLFNEWPVTLIRMLRFACNLVLLTTHLRQTELPMVIPEARAEGAAELQQVVSSSSKVLGAIATSLEILKIEHWKRDLWVRLNGIEHILTPSAF
jgi:hypothetical protein